MGLIAIKARQVIDGTGRDSIRDGVVLVDGERIAAVGPAAEVAIPREAEVLDLGDQTLLPGLVDAHSHGPLAPGEGNQPGQWQAPDAALTIRALRHLRRDLRTGVTTMRLMGDKNFNDLVYRRAIEAGEVPGPRLIVSTRAIRASNGHGGSAIPADGPDEVRRSARENLRAGADLIKLFVTGGVSSLAGSPYAPLYTRAEIEAAVDEAHRAGKPVAAHAHGGPGARWCIEAGVDTIEHGALLSREDCELMARRGTWLVMTNAIACHPTGIEQGDRGNPQIVAKLHQVRDKVAETFRTAREAGVKLTFGTDAMHGLLPFELELFVRFGGSPLEAIVAGTKRAAEACRLDDRVGTLEAGKLADAISVRGDPLQDIRDLTKVGLILKGGVRFDGLSVL